MSWQMGKTAVHYAATFGYIKLIQMFENRCHIAIQDKDKTMQTPLHSAAIQARCCNGARQLPAEAATVTTDCACRASPRPPSR